MNRIFLNYIFLLSTFFLALPTNAAVLSNFNGYESGGRNFINICLNTKAKYHLSTREHGKKIILDLVETKNAYIFNDKSISFSSYITHVEAQRHNNDTRLIFSFNQALKYHRISFQGDTPCMQLRLSFDKIKKEPTDIIDKYTNLISIKRKEKIEGQRDEPKVAKPIKNTLSGLSGIKDKVILLGDKLFGNETGKKAAIVGISTKQVSNKLLLTSEKKVIVIDPGHGGKDAGTIGRHLKLKEKHLTLKYAKELKTILERDGKYKVFLTRSSDKFITLPQRVKIAKTHKADLFISLHADAVDNPKLTGASVYTLSETASDEEAKMLAQNENDADKLASSDDAYPAVEEVVNHMISRRVKNESATFANQLVQNLKHNTSLLNESHRFANFKVLKSDNIPAVLVELGFISNKIEEKLLSSQEHMVKFNNILLQSLDKYFFER